MTALFMIVISYLACVASGKLFKVTIDSGQGLIKLATSKLCNGLKWQFSHS